MKTKISIDLPTCDKIIAGLAPRDAHPPLARAERSAAEAEQMLDSRRKELADHERTVVAELPAKVQRGEVKASALAEALRERDAAALLVAPAEVSLAKARDRVAAEEKLAAQAVDREFTRRVEVLERAVAEVAPVLAEISELAAALGAARGNGAFLMLDWPSSPMETMGRRISDQANAPAPVSLAWTGSKS